MTYLFTDHETNGFPKKTGSLVQPGQARSVQWAMLLTDENGKELAEICALLQPEGWTIPEDVSKIHGVTTEACSLYGLPGAGLVKAFCSLASKAKLVIAHNSDFDKKMTSIECAYSQRNTPDNTWYCTMLAAKPVCNIPATEKMVKAGIPGPKSPNLQEAYEMICGLKMGEGQAHNAMWDVRACKAIFFELLKRQREKQEQPQGELAHG